MNRGPRVLVIASRGFISTVTLDQRYWMWDLVLLIALAIALRVQDLGVMSLDESEALSALASRSFLDQQNLPGFQSTLNLPTGLVEWLIAQTSRVFGDWEWSVRFPSALTGVLAAIWIYLWGSHWFGAWVGRIAGFLFAIWPWPVACGRRADGGSLMLFLAFLFTISVWKVLEGNFLGHPLVEPPLIAGRKPLVPKRFLKIIPLVVLGFLCLLISPSALLVLVLFPAYLLVRLAWSWVRGKTGDCEFKRSLFYFMAALLYTAVAVIFAVWWSPPFFFSGESDHSGVSWIRIVSRMGIPDMAVGAFLLAGTGMAAFRGRPGWLVILGAWIPVCGGLVPPFRDSLNPFYPAIPFLLLLLSMPFAWAFEVARESLNHWAVEKRHVSWNLAVSLPTLVGGILLVAWFVLWSPRGTTAILNGTASRSTTQAADWRAMADFLPSIGNNAAVVTSDPLLCLYYLGRADFLYPYPNPDALDREPRTGIPILPDGRALLDFVDSGHEVWILGARASFEKTLKVPEGAALWSKLTQPPSRVWEGPGEMVICWRGELR